MVGYLSFGFLSSLCWGSLFSWGSSLLGNFLSYLFNRLLNNRLEAVFAWSVGGRLVVGWGWVVWGWLVVGWGWVVNWSWVVDWGRLVVDWSWSRLVDGLGGWLVVNWGWVWLGDWVSSWLVLWVLSLSLVLDIGNIAIWASLVADDLDTAVWEVDTVFTSGVVVVAVFSVGENWAVMRVVDTVLEVIHWWLNWLWGIAVAWGGVSWRGTGWGS